MDLGISGRTALVCGSSQGLGHACAVALAEAGDADVVLIAGKGHEAWQEIANVRRPFSDLEHARAALERRS